MTPLVLGTLLSLGALSFVLFPLFVESPSSTESARSATPGEDTSRNQAIDALREIEFDRETGKLSDADYAALRSEYTQRAVEAMRATAGPVCPNCGPRPESDALFCSGCGLRVGS